MKTESIGHPITLAAILAVGVAAVWFVVAVAASIVAPKGSLDFNTETVDSVLCPSPGPLAALQFLIWPIALMRSPTSPDYEFWHKLGQMFVDSWLPFSVVCLLSAALALWCYRHHQRFSQRGAAAWAAFVFFMGVPGIIGYLLHRRWPIMEQCQHCRKESPRDRDACLHCGLNSRRR